MRLLCCCCIGLQVELLLLHLLVLKVLFCRPLNRIFGRVDDGTERLLWLRLLLLWLLGLMMLYMLLLRL